MGGFTSASEAHTQSQGIPLMISNEESVTSGGRCPANAPGKDFDVSAINAEITISRFMDFYAGYLYVLAEDLEKVRAEEKKNKAARESADPFPSAAVSVGLQGDLIQPLVIRANAGDCVHLILRNQTENDESVSMHIHGSSFIVKATGQAATMVNKDSLVMPGMSQEFEWHVPGDAPIPRTPSTAMPFGNNGRSACSAR